MTRIGALWIGGLEPYMDEDFLRQAMNQLGQDGIVSIKVMTNKFTGEPAGYGFINFDSDQRAVLTMHRLGGKVIPNSNPPVRFKLNHNSTRLQPGEPDTSIWVGDLTPEVDDFALYNYFTQRYQTVRCAKVVLDDAGFSKGYGFVRFGSEGEQQHALAHMSGEVGLGSKPIKVSMANQKNRGAVVGHAGHQNGAAGTATGAAWAATLDVQVINWPRFSWKKVSILFLSKPPFFSC
jgi:RNA recognition motif-containing protein